MEAELIDAPIDDIDRTHNYRKTFDKAALDELAVSITAEGVIQPIVVRPGTNGKPWTLVVGERRVRASIIAKCKTVPAIVRRDLDDASARAVSIIENLQRKDVNPLEEADGFRELHEPPSSWPVDKIADTVGQKRGYVYARLKLCSLCESGREAYRKGEIDVSVAILVARIPSREAQAEAVKTFRQWGGVGYKQAQRHVHEKFMMRLAGAPFDITDEKLVAAAGSCAACPKRTGNQRELFADIKSADVCTDPSCYKKKADAAWVGIAASAEKKGQAVVPDAQIKKLFPYSSTQLAHDAPYVDLEAECWDDEKNRPYKKLVSKDAPVAIARDPSGKVHLLIKREDLAGAMKGSGVKSRAAERGRASGADAAHRRAQMKKRASALAAIEAIVAAVKPGEALWRTVLDDMGSHSFNDAIRDVVNRRGWAVKGKRPADLFKAAVAKLAVAELPGVVVELFITRGAFFSYSSAMSQSLTRAAKAFGVNLSAVEKRVAAELAAKEKAKKAKGKKKGGGK